MPVYGVKPMNQEQTLSKLIVASSKEIPLVGRPRPRIELPQAELIPENDSDAEYEGPPRNNPSGRGHFGRSREGQECGYARA